MKIYDLDYLYRRNHVPIRLLFNKIDSRKTISLKISRIFCSHSAEVGENSQKPLKMSQFILNEDAFDLTYYDNFYYIISCFACQSDGEYSVG